MTGDGATTWTHSCFGRLPHALPNGTPAKLDPAVAYDAAGNLYRTEIEWFYSHKAYSTAVALQRSSDNGLSWSAPLVAIGAQQVSGVNWNIFDKDWIGIDPGQKSPHRDAIYVSATRLANYPTTSLLSQIIVAHSTDYGKTWATAAVDRKVRYPVVQDASSIAIASDGTTYLAWFLCKHLSFSTGICPGESTEMLLSKSTDGGTTWSARSLIHRVQYGPGPCSLFPCLPNTKEPVLDEPVIAIDNSTGQNAGTLYECDTTWVNSHMLVQVTSSKDGGTTWSQPVGVAGSAITHDQFFPWCSVSTDGTLGVTWLDRRNDPANIEYEAFGAISTDGGKTFSKNYQLAAKPSNPNNDGYKGTFMGDYTGNAWADKTLYAAWPDTSNGRTAEAMVGGLRLP